MERVATLRIVQQKWQAMLIFGFRNIARTQFCINMVQGRGGVEEALKMAAGLCTHLAENLHYVAVLYFPKLQSKFPFQ